MSRRKVEQSRHGMRASTKTMIVGVLMAAVGIVGVYWKTHRRDEAPPAPPLLPTIAPVVNNNINIGAGAKMPTSEPPTLSSRSRQDADGDSPGPRVSFIFPPERSKVKPVIIVSGKVKGVPGGKHLWLVTRREPGGDIFPKKKVAPMADGNFEEKIWDYGASGRLWVCVLMTDRSETKRFNKWQRAGAANGDSPALSVKGRSTTLGCISLELDNSK